MRALILREDERARLGTLTRLHRGGKGDIARADQALAGAHRRLERAEHDAIEARHHVAGLESAVAERAAWDRTNGWHLDRVAEIDDTLAYHWAEVSLRAVRADDPLAFGVERLRNARATYQGDLDHLVKAIPLDRRDALADAERELHRHEELLRHAERRVRSARGDRARAGERRWGLRDKAAIDRTEQQLADAGGYRERCEDSVAKTSERVGKERQAVQKWAEATRETAEERTRLSAAVADLSDALNATRAQRVAAAALDPASEMWRTLGAPPSTRGGLAAWCGIAQRLDAWVDARPASSALDHIAPRSRPLIGPRPNFSAARKWDELAALIDRSRDLVTIASRSDPGWPGRLLEDQDLWQPALKAATDSIQLERPARGISHGFGAEL